MRKKLFILFIVIFVTILVFIYSFRKEEKITAFDLSGETNRQVIVDKERGQYLGHPATVLLADGKTIIAIYPKGHGEGELILKRSVDGGLSWGERLRTPESWKLSKDAPSIYHFNTPDGHVILLFIGHYPIRKSISHDGGISWGELEAIGDFGGMMALSSVERLRDGSYIGLFHDDMSVELARMQTKREVYLELANERPELEDLINNKLLPIVGKEVENLQKNLGVFKIFKVISSDAGVTWGLPQVIFEHKDIDLAEPYMVRSPDGNEIAVLMRENSRRKNSFVMFSRDEGMGWSEPRELPWVLTGDRHVAKYSSDGRLIVVFRDMARGSHTKGDLVAWIGTYEDIVAGREGQYRVRLLDNKGDSQDGGYAGLELLSDGTFVATSYGVWDEGEEPYIMSIRFSLKELDGM